MSEQAVGKRRLDVPPDSGLDDSGLRHTFEGGGEREMAPGKGRFDLMSPFANTELAKHFERGAEKYQPRNWEKGLPLSSFVDSAKRHAEQLMMGDESEPHAVALLWNAHCLVHTMEMIRLGLLSEKLDDLPHFLDASIYTEDDSEDELQPNIPGAMPIVDQTFVQPTT